jgi:hypothetical protein
MTERANALDGSLEAGPRPDGGFRVLARLPLDAGRSPTGSPFSNQNRIDESSAGLAGTDGSRAGQDGVAEDGAREASADADRSGGERAGGHGNGDGGARGSGRRGITASHGGAP